MFFLYVKKLEYLENSYVHRENIQTPHKKVALLSYFFILREDNHKKKKIETNLFKQTYQTEVESLIKFSYLIIVLSIMCVLVSQVPKVTHTEFCQGRTMRWALAWSFYEDVIVPVSFSPGLFILQ